MYLFSTLHILTSLHCIPFPYSDKLLILWYFCSYLLKCFGFKFVNSSTFSVKLIHRYFGSYPSCLSNQIFPVSHQFFLQLIHHFSLSRKWLTKLFCDCYLKRCKNSCRHGLVVCEVVKTLQCTDVMYVTSTRFFWGNLKIDGKMVLLKCLI